MLVLSSKYFQTQDENHGSPEQYFEVGHDVIMMTLEPVEEIFWFKSD
jgi:hypothetical protein